MADDKARTPTRTVESGLTRRDALRIIQVAGVGAAAGGTLLWNSSGGARALRGTCRLCQMHCGIIGTIRDDRLVRVEGDLESAQKGFICMHANALGEIVHSEDRLTRPLLRKNNGSFTPVTWKDAYGFIAERIEKIQASHGPQAIAVQTGWPFVRHPLIGFLRRFCCTIGSPNLITVASSCEAAGRMGKALTAGGNFWPDADHAKTVVVWGANPPVSAPPFSRSVHGATSRKRYLIVIDTRRTALANKAKYFLRVRPGTDGALALGIMHVVIKEKLYDEAFVQEHTEGFDELAALVDEYPPERASEITSVPKQLIETVARVYASNGPSCIWDGLGVEHHPNGVQTVRAIACLQALCGNIDRVGGGQLHKKAGANFPKEILPVLYQLNTPEPVPPIPMAKPLGYESYPLYDVFNRQAQGNLLADAILRDEPYPVRGLLLFGSDPVVTAPNTGEMTRAMDGLGLLVSIDPFLCATGELADVVLPAATFVEGEEAGPQTARESFLPERAESRPDWRILFELARTMGHERFFPWRSFSEALAAPHVRYHQDPTHELRPQTASATPRFPSTTGKVELYSKVLEDFGQAPVPDWTPLAAQPSKDYPLHLVTGPRTRHYINSQFKRIEAIRRGRPEPRAQIHPDAAAAVGVRDGQRVRVVSPQGHIEILAEVTEDVHPEVVVVPSGWQSINANQLTASRPLDPISGFPPYRSGVCRLEVLVS